jgi:hypothetical protein
MDSISTPNINSSFSFIPLIKAWENMIATGREGSQQIYKDLLEKVKQYPELLEPITDYSIFEKHHVIIEQMMTTLFPVTLSDEEDLFGVSIPFQFKMVYGSKKLRSLFMGKMGSEVGRQDHITGKKIAEEKIAGAYMLILSRMYGMNVKGRLTNIHLYKCPETALDRYMEVELDTRFVEVKVKGDLPPIPPACCNAPENITDIMKIPGIQQQLPLNQFEFEGMVIMNIREVTQRESLNIIRNILLETNNFADRNVFLRLQTQVQNLLGVPGVHTAIKPFYNVNNHLVFSEIYTTSDLGQKNTPSTETVQHVYNEVNKTFHAGSGPLFLPEVTEETVKKYPFLVILYEQGWKSAIICPLFTDKQAMLGALIILCDRPGMLKWEHAARLEPAIPLFRLALEKSQESLNNQVDRVIKDQFTAVQDAVEWKFTEAALTYLRKKSNGENTKIEPISFENVYPLYGAIDIRNSSIERNNAMQLDLLEQLNQARDIIMMARKEVDFPLLGEVEFKIKKYIHSVNNILFADDEISIHHFLKTDIIDLFNHIRSIIPSLDATIQAYFTAVDSPVEMVYHHRKEYEESITIINNEVAKFIDEAQVEAQRIFPHYFERFVTDGVDFNIYIGESISPTKKFDFFYLKNLKIWQLSTLARAARVTRRLEKKLPLPLQTSQLILAHSFPISISFRTAERKFDVDGAYNIRYEIIKKRIDKVHIKNSNERLTQPGMIAIVYSQPQEAKEYLQYIEFLQNQGLLTGEVEKFDLEELQGVSGLKGLRVAIKFEEEELVPGTKDQSKKGTLHS